MQTDRDKVHILVVDDNQPARQLVKSTLAIAGYTSITEASDGSKALEALQRRKFDLIICDWDMPGTSGIDVLRAVRADESLSATPFLMVTANQQREFVEAAIEAGVNDYVAKPYRLSTLNDKTTRLLGGK
jgi:two-component system chemotaxis response regulator CheY